MKDTNLLLTHFPNPEKIKKKKKREKRQRDGGNCIKLLKKPENNIKCIYFDVTERQDAAILLHFTSYITGFIC